MSIIINSPYTEPSQHWKFVEEKQPLEHAEGRRIARYMVAAPKANPYQYRGIFVEMSGQMDRQLNAYCNPKGRVLALVRLIRRDSAAGRLALSPGIGAHRPALLGVDGAVAVEVLGHHSGNIGGVYGYE